MPWDNQIMPLKKFGLNKIFTPESFKGNQAETSYDLKGNLKNGVAGIHLESNPFKVGIWDDYFIQKRHLEINSTEKHQKLKPFKCSLCEASFTKNANLKIHVAGVHEKLKPFQCNYCKTSFTTRGRYF